MAVEEQGNITDLADAGIMNGGKVTYGGQGMHGLMIGKWEWRARVREA
jgi:hypothetical protein